MSIHDFKVHGESGPFLFLLHGWCCSQAFWRFQIEQLASRFRVVTFDLEGHGSSPLATDISELTIDRFAENVVHVADALDAGKLALVGHSMGGPVAIEASLRLAGRCRFILGVDTFTDGKFYLRRPAEEIAFRLQQFEAHFEATMAAMVRNITAPGTDAAIIDEITRDMALCDRDVALAALRSLLEWDIEARWPLLDVPVATINSALLRSSAELDLPGLDVHLMHDVGHFPMIESRQAFNSVAAALLDQHAFG